MKRKLSVVAVLVLTMALTMGGCKDGPFHEKMDEYLSISFVTITATQDQFEATCTADPTQKECVVIEKARLAHNGVVSAMNLYCAGPGWDEGGECNPPKAEKEHLLSRVEEALREFRPLMNQLEELL